MKKDNQFITGIAVIVITLLAWVVVFGLFVNIAQGSEKLSKRETWSVYCGIDKNTVTSDMKRLSRREIWSACVGENKKEAPSLSGEKKEASGRSKKKDEIIDDLKPLVEITDTKYALGRIKGNSMAHVGIKDGGLYTMVREVPKKGSYIVFSAKETGKGDKWFVKELKSTMGGCLWVEGRPDKFENGSYSIDSRTKWGWVCEYEVYGYIK